jgi:hypothetical protein
MMDLIIINDYLHVNIIKTFTLDMLPSIKIMMIS